MAIGKKNVTRLSIFTFLFKLYYILKNIELYLNMQFAQQQEKKKENCKFFGIAKQPHLLLLLTLVWWIGWWKPGVRRGAGNLTIYSLNKQEARWSVEVPHAATAAWNLYRTGTKSTKKNKKKTTVPVCYCLWGRPVSLWVGEANQSCQRLYATFSSGSTSASKVKY